MELWGSSDPLAAIAEIESFTRDESPEVRQLARRAKYYLEVDRGITTASVDMTFTGEGETSAGDSAEDIAVGKAIDEDVKEFYANQAKALRDYDESVASLKRSKGQDAALTTANYGGIDFNPDNLNLYIRRDEQGIPLPVYQQIPEFMDIEGFVPIIIQIIPAINLQNLLGLS